MVGGKVTAFISFYKDTIEFNSHNCSARDLLQIVKGGVQPYGGRTIKYATTVLESREQLEFAKENA